MKLSQESQSRPATVQLSQRSQVHLEKLIDATTVRSKEVSNIKHLQFLSPRGSSGNTKQLFPARNATSKDKKSIAQTVQSGGRDSGKEMRMQSPPSSHQLPRPVDDNKKGPIQKVRITEQTVNNFLSERRQSQHQPTGPLHFFPSQLKDPSQSKPPPLATSCFNSGLPLSPDKVNEKDIKKVEIVYNKGDYSAMEGKKPAESARTEPKRGSLFGDIFGRIKMPFK